MGIPDEDLTKVIGAYPLDIDDDGMMDLVVLRLGRNLILKGEPDCRFEVANSAFAFDGGRDWTTAFSATWEKGQAFPTLAIGNYVDRMAPGAPWGTCADNYLDRPHRGDKPDYADPVAALAELLLAVDAVHRLEPVGRAVAPRHQRPAILPRRRGADVARRSRQAAAPLHGRGGLAAPVDLRHGHRPGRSLRRRLSGLRADLDGRHQAAAARRGIRHRPAGLQGHRLSARRHRGAALYRRRRAPVDRLAQPVRRLQQ